MTLFDDLQPEHPVDSPAPHQRLRLTVAYDGTGFHGFAPQAAGVRTVGGELAAAIARVLRLPATPTLTCAGRTDAGVHAWGQVVHVDVPAGADLEDLHRRLVKLLAPAIVVREVTVASPDWDARRSARWRLYRYTILNRPLPDPFWHGRVWHVAGPLDLRTMQLAVDPIIGEHDFSSFCRKVDGDDGEHSLIRRVLDADWLTDGDGLVRFEIRSTAFCQQMVRSLVGMFVDVGLGKRRAGEVAAVLRARDRAVAAPVAPPQGLCLWEVGYVDE